jgi:ATP-dependent helicase HrpA
LEKQGTEIGIRLFRTKLDAESSSATAVRRLAELVMPNDMKWLRKEVAGLARLLPVPGKKPADFRNALDQLALTSKSTTAPFLTSEVLERTAADHLLAHALVLNPVFPLTKQRFDALLEKTRRELPTLVHQLGDWIKRIATLRHDILSSPRRYTGLEQDLQRLAPSDFLTRVSFPRLPHLHRYLRAVQIRAERASVSPAKDADRARHLTPFVDWEKRVPEENRERFRWLLEEFRVSLFAQELGTAEPASAQRLRSLGDWPE